MLEFIFFPIHFKFLNFFFSFWIEITTTSTIIFKFKPNIQFIPDNFNNAEM